MGGIPWRWLFGAVVAIGATAVWIAPDPAAERMAAVPTPQLVKYLADEHDNVWQAAADEILKRGRLSVPICTAAIPTAHVEHRLRLFYVLEQQLLSSEPRTAEFAAESLEEFQRGDRLDLSMPADRVLNENSALRTSRALARIQELGGIYRPLDPDRSFESASAGMILLDHRWQGGNAGLAHLVRVRGLSQLHISPGAHLTSAAIADLLHRLPRTHVVYEGQGCLGIEGEVSEFGFCVKGVGQDTPAVRSGIQTGDVILGCDDFAMSPSSPVALRVTRYAPGRVIRLHVRRDRTRFSVNVELGDAFGTGACACLADLDEADASAGVMPVKVRMNDGLAGPTLDSGPESPESPR